MPLALAFFLRLRLETAAGWQLVDITFARPLSEQ